MERRTPKRRKTHPRLRRIAILGLLLAGLAFAGRAALPGMVRNYVNRTLDRSLIYSGEIGDIDIHLWRGAYSISNIRVSKRFGTVPVPLFAAERVDFAVQWNALLRGRLVGRILMSAPELNFVDAPTAEGDQTGADGPWLAILEELFPFQINRARIENGSIHFRAYWTEEPFDIYLSEIQGTIDNLGNISHETNPLSSTVQAEGLVMDQAPFDFRMTLDPFSYRPTFHLTSRILGLDVTRLNPLARAYGNLDFKSGWFDLVVDVDAKEGRIDGYVKPLFRNLEAFEIPKDLEQTNPIQVLWEALAGATINAFSNLPRDQFGTLIPFRGDLGSSTNVDLLATLGNLLRNAFVRAYLPLLEPADHPDDFLEFGPPDFSDMLSITNPP